MGRRRSVIIKTCDAIRAVHMEVTPTYAWIKTESIILENKSDESTEGNIQKISENTVVKGRKYAKKNLVKSRKTSSLIVLQL